MRNKLVILAICLTFLGFSFAQEEDGGFGARANFGIVGISGKHFKDLDGGFAVGGGFFMLRDIDFAILNIGASVMYKKTISIEEKVEDYYSSYSYEAKATEITLEIPVLLRFPISDMLYVEAGPQINLAFFPEIEETVKYNGGSESDSDDYEDRNFIDVGITAGIGLNINEQLSVDARYFYGIFTNFADDMEGTLWQITFGINYLF